MSDTSVLEGLIQALRRLPGVGVKSASRMAYHLLQHDREGAEMISQALHQAAAQVQHCERCHTFTTPAGVRHLLGRGTRHHPLVRGRTPADQSAVERTAAYKGQYFVLMGRISPLDGFGPKDIGLQKLIERASDGVVKEVILATNFTAEGEATAHVLGEALKKRGVQVTRLARGVPVGSELEYVDLGTIAHALVDRRDA